MAAGMCTNGILRGRRRKKKKKKHVKKTVIFMRLEPLNCLMLQGKLLSSLCGGSHAKHLPQGRERLILWSGQEKGALGPLSPLSPGVLLLWGSPTEGGMGLSQQGASHTLRVCLKLETGIRKPSFYQENSSLLAFPLTDSDRNQGKKNVLSSFKPPKVDQQRNHPEFLQVSWVCGMFSSTPVSAMILTSSIPQASSAPLLSVLQQVPCRPGCLTHNPTYLFLKRGSHVPGIPGTPHPHPHSLRLSNTHSTNK